MRSWRPTLEHPPIVSGIKAFPSRGRGTALAVDEVRWEIMPDITIRASEAAVNSSLLTPNSSLPLDDLSTQMINLMLNDLSAEVRQLAVLRLPIRVEVLHLDLLEPHRRADAVQRQASLLRLIRPRLRDDDGVEHHDVLAAHIDDDDILSHADHIRRHADASVPVSAQRVAQVLRQRQIAPLRRFGRLAEEKHIPDNFFLHNTNYTPLRGRDRRLDNIDRQPSDN